MSDNDLLAQMNVSRETMDRLHVFEKTLLKWNPKINLVSKASVEHLWKRHIIDSVQVFQCVNTCPKTWVDIGSGGGFPGIIVAILAAEFLPDMQVSLIESDQRKSVFLRSVARECGVSVNVITNRIEQVEPQNAEILSARALADLNVLLGFAERHLSPKGIALFQKGARWKKEVDNAREQWRFDVEPITSLTEADAVILKIQGVARV